MNEKELTSQPRWGTRSQPISRSLSPTEAAWLRQDSCRSGLRSFHASHPWVGWGGARRKLLLLEKGRGSLRRHPLGRRRGAPRDGRSDRAGERGRSGAVRAAPPGSDARTSPTMPSLRVRLTTIRVEGETGSQGLRHQDGGAVGVHAHVRDIGSLRVGRQLTPDMPQGGVDGAQVGVLGQLWRLSDELRPQRYRRRRQQGQPEPVRSPERHGSTVGLAGSRDERPMARRPRRAPRPARNEDRGRGGWSAEHGTGPVLVDVEAVETHLTAVRVDQLVGPEQLPEIGIDRCGRDSAVVGPADAQRRWALRTVSAFVHRRHTRDEVIGSFRCQLGGDSLAVERPPRARAPEISTGLAGRGSRRSSSRTTTLRPSARKERTKASAVAPAPDHHGVVTTEPGTGLVESVPEQPHIPTRAP